MILLTGWAYAPAWSAGFVFEDLKWLDLAAANATWRPLTTLTWIVAPTPVVAHGLNLALHLVTVGLVGLLARDLGSRLTGWTAASLFAVHPLNVEAVAYAAGRADVLAAMGVVGACLLARRGVWLGAGLCLWLGWCAKETAIVGLPLVLLVATDRPRWIWGACGVGLVAGVLALGGWSQLVNLGEMPGVSVTAGSWFLAQATAAWRLVSQTLMPLGLTVDPDIDAVPHLLRWVSVAGLGALALLAWRQRRTVIGLGLAWTLIAILPRLIVQTPQSYLNAHQFYVPVIGLLLAGSGLVKR